MHFNTLLKKFKYELIIFTLIIVPAVPAFYSGPSKYYIAYLFDYKIGYTSRVLIGSFVDLLTTGKITGNWLRGFITIFYIIAFLTVAVLLGKLMRNVTGDMKNIVIFMIVFFLLAKYAMWVWYIYFGIFDLFWFLFALLAIISVNNRFAKWLIPLLCVLGLATHYTFAFIYMPLILALVLYDLFISSFAKSSIALTVVTVLTMGCSSVYFFIFSSMTIKLQNDALVDYIFSKSNLQFDDFYIPIIKLYFGSGTNNLKEQLKIIINAIVTGFQLKAFLLIVISVLPLIICFFYIWIKAYKLSSSISEKFFMLFCTLLPLASLPAFLFSSDIYRFLAQVIITQFCLVFFLVFKKNAAIILSLKNLANFFRKHPELLFILIVLSLSYSYKIPGWVGIIV